MLSARAAPTAPMFTDTSELSSRPTALIRTSTRSASTWPPSPAIDTGGDEVGTAAEAGGGTRVAPGPGAFDRDGAARRARAGDGSAAFGSRALEAPVPGFERAPPAP